MKLDRSVRRFWPSSVVVVFGLLGALEPAHSECLSPSAASGTAATTVFRCADQPVTARQEQPAVNTEKTTVVERGPADVPWFIPKAMENSTEPVKAPQVQAPQVQVPEIQAPQVEEKIEVKPEKKLSATKKTIRKKLVKLKPAKTKTTKALTAKAKPEKRMSKAKAKVAPAKPEKPGENTVVWTKKDMPVGNRIVNWLGL